MVGWQREKFSLLKKRKIVYEELIDRYDTDGHLFKKGNVGNICLLRHLESEQKMIVVSTHMHWNPKLDYVKYGQAFWLLMKVSEFLDDNELSLDTTPIVICGDFNAEPTTSSIHMMLNKDYQITENSGRAHYRTGIKAYRTKGGSNIQTSEGYRIF